VKEKIPDRLMKVADYGNFYQETRSKGEQQKHYAQYLPPF